MIYLFVFEKNGRAPDEKSRQVLLQSYLEYDNGQKESEIVLLCGSSIENSYKFLELIKEVDNFEIMLINSPKVVLVDDKMKEELIKVSERRYINIRDYLFGLQEF